MVFIRQCKLITKKKHSTNPYVKMQKATVDYYNELYEKNLTLYGTLIYPHAFDKELPVSLSLLKENQFLEMLRLNDYGTSPGYEDFQIFAEHELLPIETGQIKTRLECLSMDSVELVSLKR